MALVLRFREYFRIFCNIGHCFEAVTALLFSIYSPFRHASVVYLSILAVRLVYLGPDIIIPQIPSHLLPKESMVHGRYIAILQYLWSFLKLCCSGPTRCTSDQLSPTPKSVC